jgi:hypothetical protein
MLNKTAAILPGMRNDFVSGFADRVKNLRARNECKERKPLKENTNFVKTSALKHVSDFLKISRRAVLGRVVLFAVIFSLMVSAGMAKPVTYTGFTITDGKLGSWAFHNARVYLTFRGNTNNVQLIHPYIDPNNPGIGTVDVWVNLTGKASVTIISGEKAVSAKFADNEISVSLDLGDTGFLPPGGARGVGFSSVTAAGFEPAYPLGIEDGTIDWGDILEKLSPGVPSPEVTQLSTDLMHTTRFSGRAWPCVGFPNACGPATPLQTDKGPLYLYVPYSQAPNSNPKNICTSPTGGASANDTCDSLSAGFFLADVGESSEENDTPSLITSPQAWSKNPITYYGYVISDVTLGGEHYPGAQVYLSMDADTSTVVPFSNVLPYGFKNAKGKAHVTIVSGSHVVSADFEKGQIYVYYDIAHSSVGFGSTAGGTGYPLSITANNDCCIVAINGLVENSSVGAVSDLTLNPSDATLYTAATATLPADLTHATTLSGGASSCLGFAPVTSTCSSLSPIRLETNRGGFYITEPYRQDLGAGGQYSINWGVFWSENGF